MVALSTTTEPDDFVIDQGWNLYSEEHHAIWRKLMARQSKLLPGRKLY